MLMKSDYLQQRLEIHIGVAELFPGPGADCDCDKSHPHIEAARAPGKSLTMRPRPDDAKRRVVNIGCEVKERTPDLPLPIAHIPITA